MSKRDWKSAKAKCASEDFECRVCGRPGIQPAHIIRRAHTKPGGRRGEGEFPDNIVPLCQDHHDAYDNGDFDLIKYLSLDEQGYAGSLVGAVTALECMTNCEWVPVERELRKVA